MTMGEVTDRPLEDSTDVVDGGEMRTGGHGNGKRGWFRKEGWGGVGWSGKAKENTRVSYPSH